MTDNASAGATPVAGGATPPQTPAQPAPGSTTAAPTSATGDDDALGDAGKRAIRAERDRAAAAERERDQFKSRLEELENSSKSEHEKALAQAKKDGAAEVAPRYQAALRRSEVRSALSAAGVSANVLDLATRADEFASLKVNDEGAVEGLAGAVEAFKKAMPDLFKPATPRPTGAAYGGGPQGAPATGGVDMNSIIRRAAGRN
jgi:hypothetical protein